MRGAKRDRGRKIRAHAHGEKLQPIALRDLGGQRKVRPGSFVKRRNAHEAGDCQPVLIATRCQECVRILRQDTRLLRLGAGVDFGKQYRSPLLFAHLFRQSFAETCPIDGMDRIEKRDRFFRLVRLQRADEMQLRTRMFRKQSWPLCFCLLNTVLAENALTRTDCRLDVIRGECLGNCDQRRVRGIAVGIAAGTRDFRPDLLEILCCGSGHALPISHRGARRHFK